MGKAKSGKRPISQWINILLYLLVGAGSGILVLMDLEKYQAGGASKADCIIRLALLFISLYLAMFLQIVIHEAGHLVFGLMTGYRFLSFRIFSLMWLKGQDKISLKKMSLAGTAGQCLMSPPDMKNGTIPVMLYNFGGAIMNVISSLVFLAAALACPAGSPVRVFLYFLVIIGVVYALTNGVPSSPGPVNNDGRNALDLSRDPQACRAFWIQLKANEQTAKGVRLKDMPEEWFAMPPEDQLDNALIATVAVLRANRLIDEHRFEEADQLMAHLLEGENGIVGLYRTFLTMDRVFVELITQNRAEKVDAMLTKEHRKIMKVMKAFPSVLRTEYACALLHEHDAKKAETIRAQFDKNKAAYPYPSEITAESELMRIAEESSAS